MARSVLLAVIAGAALLGLVRPAQAQAQSKVAVIVMENKAYTKIVGSRNAPYINSPIQQGKLFTNYSAVINGSLHNYLAMTSGLTAKQSPPSPNVFQAIDATGGSVTWTEFEESMSGNCGAGTIGNVAGSTEPLYSRGHDPAYQYRQNASRAQHDVPMTTATFQPASLPRFSYIVPNQCNDMHTLPTAGQACPTFYGSNSASNTITRRRAQQRQHRSAATNPLRRNIGRRSPWRRSPVDVATGTPETAAAGEASHTYDADGATVP